MALRIDQYKEDAAEYRSQIRSYLFKRVRDNHGMLAFYQVNEIADADEGDGRVWRLKVGNIPLQTDRLQMIGGGEVVGDIPRGLPSFTLPRLDYHIILHLLPFVIIISLMIVICVNCK